ncbi:MAG: hypothetical protein C5B46_06170, partial [Proteobacteria bacterium]
MQMSETCLNILECGRVYSGVVHASIAERCVAALSAEPETFAELEDALIRYQKPFDGVGSLASLRPSHEINFEPWDAGIVIIDLAARLVAIQSTYSQPGREGTVTYHDGHAAIDLSIPYRLSDSWDFLSCIESYPMQAASRRKVRRAGGRLDVRAILYGRPLVEFILTGVKHICWPASGLDEEKVRDALYKQVSAIHENWLLTPRADLQMQSPRDLLMAKRQFIDFDLDSRERQWSEQGEAPPCLRRDSDAFRFAGFGTHENVIYYDLVRHLLWNAIESHERVGEMSREDGTSGGSHELSFEAEVVRLEQIQKDWWENPQDDCDGKTPVNIVENERLRLPLALLPAELIIDHDCPLCVMSAEQAAHGFGPGFLHFDSSNMDDSFAFSFCGTREEWEEENRRQEEFDRDFNRRWKEREARIAAGEDKDTVDQELGFGWSKSLED